MLNTSAFSSGFFKWSHNCNIFLLKIVFVFTSKSNFKISKSASNNFIELSYLNVVSQNSLKNMLLVHLYYKVFNWKVKFLDRIWFFLDRIWFIRLTHFTHFKYQNRKAVAQIIDRPNISFKDNNYMLKLQIRSPIC